MEKREKLAVDLSVSASLIESFGESLGDDIQVFLMETILNAKAEIDAMGNNQEKEVVKPETEISNLSASPVAEHNLELVGAVNE